MTTPPPPWEAHPPLPEDEFGDVDRGRDVASEVHDVSDEDTGPIRIAAPVDEPTVYAAPVDERPQYRQPEYEPPVRQVAAPPPPPLPRPEETYAGRFTAPLSVDPRTIPVRRNNSRPALIAAAVAAAVLLVGLAAWWLWPSGGDEETVQTPAAPTVDAAAQAKLMGLLPQGYSSDACSSGDVPEGALAVVTCTKNADTGGPVTATYSLMKDKKSLDAAIDRTIKDAGVVNCPGRIQSPGPWRRNANPQQIAGTLVCGMPQTGPLVAWTTDASLLLNVSRSGSDGPTLDQLFTWWQSHS